MSAQAQVGGLWLSRSFQTHFRSLSVEHHRVKLSGVRINWHGEMPLFDRALSICVKDLERDRPKNAR